MSCKVRTTPACCSGHVHAVWWQVLFEVRSGVYSVVLCLSVSRCIVNKYTAASASGVQVLCVRLGLHLTTALHICGHASVHACMWVFFDDAFNSALCEHGANGYVAMIINPSMLVQFQVDDWQLPQLGSFRACTYYNVVFGLKRFLWHMFLWCPHLGLFDQTIVQEYYSPMIVLCANLC